MQNQKNRAHIPNNYEQHYDVKQTMLEDDNYEQRYDLKIDKILAKESKYF